MRKYKGYVGEVRYDPEERTFQGKVVGTRDIITFQGDSVDELQREFERSVDVYLDVCREAGKEPDRRYPGRFIVEVPPAVQRELDALAAAEGMSLRAFTAQILSRAAGQPPVGEGKTATTRRARVTKRKGTGRPKKG